MAAASQIDPLTAADGGVARRARSRAAVRLLPFLFALFVANFLDRSSIAYAALGMKPDLGFTDDIIGLAAGWFFGGYITTQVIGAILVERWSARRVISIILIAWGALTGLTALVNTPAELYAARFALGVAEGGFFTGVVVYLSQWFTRADRAKATCNFFAAVPLSLAIGSPVAGWILGQSWRGIPGWRWLFVVEGVPAVILGAIATLYLTDKPRDAQWLREDERRWIEEMLQQEAPAPSGDAGAIRTVNRALRNPLVLLLGGTAFLQYFMGYSVVFFLPKMLQRLSSLPDVQVGMLGALPYLAAFATVVIMGWSSDRSHERRWHCALPQFAAAAALVALATQPRSVAGMVALLAVVSATSLCFVPLFWSLSTELLGPSGAAAVGLINTIASVAGFAGPVAFGYLSQRTGSYSPGLILIAAFAVAAGLSVLSVPRARQAVPHGI